MASCNNDHNSSSHYRRRNRYSGSQSSRGPGAGDEGGERGFYRDSYGSSSSSSQRWRDDNDDSHHNRSSSSGRSGRGGGDRRYHNSTSSSSSGRQRLSKHQPPSSGGRRRDRSRSRSYTDSDTDGGDTGGNSRRKRHKSARREESSSPLPPSAVKQEGSVKDEPGVKVEDKLTVPPMHPVLAKDLDLRKEVARLTRANEKLSSKLAITTAERNKNHDKLMAATRGKKGGLSTTERYRLNATVADLKEKHVKDLNAKEDRILELNTRLNELESQQIQGVPLGLNPQEIEVLQQEKEDLKKRVETLEAELTNIEATKRSLQEENTRLLIDDQKKAELEQQRANRVVALGAQVEALRAENEKLRTESANSFTTQMHAELNELLKEKQQRIAELEKEKEALNDKMDFERGKLRHDIIELQRSVKDQQGAVEIVQGQLEKSSRDYLAKLAECSSLRKQCSSLHKQMRESNAANTRKSRDLDDVEELLNGHFGQDDTRPGDMSSLAGRLRTVLDTSRNNASLLLRQRDVIKVKKESAARSAQENRALRNKAEELEMIISELKESVEENRNIDHEGHRAPFAAHRDYLRSKPTPEEFKENRVVAEKRIKKLMLNNKEPLSDRFEEEIRKFNCTQKHVFMFPKLALYTKFEDILEELRRSSPEHKDGVLRDIRNGAYLYAKEDWPTVLKEHQRLMRISSQDRIAFPSVLCLPVRESLESGGHHMVMYVISYDPKNKRRPFVLRYDPAGEKFATQFSHLVVYKNVFENEKYEFDIGRKWKFKHQRQSSQYSNLCSLFCLRFARNVADLLESDHGRELFEQQILPGTFDKQVFQSLPKRKKELRVFLSTSL